MNKKIDFSNFIVEDGQYLKRWDFLAPLFDNFFILGPESFDPICMPTCLFRYPHKMPQNEHQNSNNNNNNYRLDKDENEDGNQLTQFFFPDGIHYIENDKNYLAEPFSKPPNVHDHIIFIKSDGSIPHYYFGIRFRCSPYARPSFFSPNEQNKNFYSERKKKTSEKEMTILNETRTCPTCLFAFVFETQHPFFELYFNLIHQIAHVEAFEKSKMRNLIMLHSLIIYNQSNNNSCSSNNKGNDDGFIIVDKNDSSSNNDEFNCIVSIKDQNTNPTKDCFNSHLKCIHSFISFSFPKDVFNVRIQFLNTLIGNNNFPSIGKNMIIRTGELSSMMFSWRVPTVAQSCCSLIHYGIIPLLEWISLNDFIRIISLLFLEVSVIVAGTELESIVRVVSSFPHIVFPFAWMFPIMTIIPDSFIDFLGSPFPFIAGIFLNEKSIRKVANLSDLDEIIIIDLANHKIKWPRKEYPTIACANEYKNSLKRFCLAKKQPYMKSNVNSSNELLIIPSEKIKKKKSFFDIFNIFSKIDELNIMNKIRCRLTDEDQLDLFFDSGKIEDIVDSILNLNQNVFISKINPSIVTRVNNCHNGEKEIGSMMIDELYFLQFPEKEKDKAFIELFMKTQMFISYREQACKLKTDEEAEILNK